MAIVFALLSVSVSVSLSSRRLPLTVMSSVSTEGTVLLLPLSLSPLSVPPLLLSLLLLLLIRFLLFLTEARALPPLSFALLFTPVLALVPVDLVPLAVGGSRYCTPSLSSAKNEQSRPPGGPTISNIAQTLSVVSCIASLILPYCTMFKSFATEV